MKLHKNIHHAKVSAAEEAVLARIPREFSEILEHANRKFAANGGCPGCGSKRIGIHRMPCSELSKQNE